MYTKVELENLIKKHAQLYYDGESEISDREFDELVDQLRAIDPNSECLTSVGWGYDINKASGTKVNHKYQTVGSLTKYKTYESIPMDFKGHKVVISAKLDGISAVCYFINGTLVRAVTRGNGSVGIDITDKISKITRTRLTGSLDKFTGSIRGELVINNKNWKKMLESNPDLKSQRNYVSGIINRNEITDDLQYVSFIPYNILGFENHDFRVISQVDILVCLDTCYNTVVPYECSHMNNFSHLENLYKEFAEVYPVDGVVVTERICNVENGVVSYKQIAVKFESATEDTRVDHVQWNMSRTGRLVPVVVVDPINLDGATISRVTGFNAKFIKDNKIDTGAIVNIMRSNLVIPDIQEVVKEADEFNLPIVCPDCGSRLEWSGVDLVCKNPDCAGKDFYDLIHWTNVIAPVDGLGGTLKVRFYEDRNISSIDELFNYFREYKGEDIGKSSTDKKFSEMLRKLLIDKVDLVKVLAGMNIKRLGITSATKLATDSDLIKNIVDTGMISFSSFDKISKLVGSATASSINDDSSKFIHILTLMKDRIDFCCDKDEVIENAVNIAVTGALSMKRSDFEKIAKEHGYVLSGNLKNCKYLVTNTPDSGSSKNAAADKFGVQKITESDFMKLIGG